METKQDLVRKITKRDFMILAMKFDARLGPTVINMEINEAKFFDITDDYLLELGFYVFTVIGSGDAFKDLEWYGPLPVYKKEEYKMEIFSRILIDTCNNGEECEVPSFIIILFKSEYESLLRDFAIVFDIFEEVKKLKRVSEIDEKFIDDLKQRIFTLIKSTLQVY